MFTVALETHCYVPLLHVAQGQPGSLVMLLYDTLPLSCYILPLLYVASLMCYASHICCAGQPAVLLCALHYVGSGPVLIYIR